jgi:large subunit ribosomal protein L24
MKIKKGDKVVVIAGKDKGKTGEVTLALPKKAQVVVDGVHVVVKHQKSRQARSQGQIINKSMPVHVSNVALIGEKNKGVRVGYSVEKSGEKQTKVRVARPSGKKI